jgi:hypothetical protein
VPTPQAAEVCAYCGRGTIRTDTWIQIHAQCPLSRIFKRYFRPTIDLLTWLSVVTALLANAIAAARGEAALKKSELAACAGRLVLRQRAVAYAAIGTTMPSSGWINNAMHASRPSLHVEDNVLFLSAIDWSEQLCAQTRFFNCILHILAFSKKAK